LDEYTEVKRCKKCGWYGRRQRVKDNIKMNLKTTIEFMKKLSAD
jgi:hypothetical protein